eukprot:915103-Amphidinium_carterae.1
MSSYRTTPFGVLFCRLTGYVFFSFFEGIAGMTMLSAIWLSNNRFTRQVPEEGFLSTLGDCCFDRNTFTGTLPARGVRGMVKAWRFDVSNNALEGIFSIGAFNVQNSMEAFHIDNNKFQGSLPWGCGLFTALESLRIEHNRLSKICSQR